MEKDSIKVIATNREARHEYFIEEEYEAGIELVGTEVKSIRAGTMNLKDAWCGIKDGQLLVNQMHISPYDHGNRFNVDSRRPRRLLMHKREIMRLYGKVKQDGFSLIPLSVYFKGSRVKVCVGLCKGKKLLPKVFKDENRIKEVKGIYVPFWLYDTDADAQIHYKATRVRTWSSGDYIYTETNHYSVHRGGSLGFDRVPVDGSTKMDDTLMESIEPFNIADAVPFRTAYLPGYIADKYDVDAASSIDRANKRIKQSTEDAFRSTVAGYTSVTTVDSNIRLQNGKARYALYPVWILNTDWNGQKFTFAINGQTGKIAGNLPMDKSAFWTWMLGVAGAAAAAVFALSYLLWLL